MKRVRSIVLAGSCGVAALLAAASYWIFTRGPFASLQEQQARMCADEHVAQACFFAGQAFVKGLQVDRDTARGKSLLERACKEIPAACVDLGELLLTPGEHFDQGLGTETLTRTCEDGLAAACVALAPETSPATTRLPWLNKACALKDAASCDALGLILANETPPPPEVLLRFTQGCVLGSADACRHAAVTRLCGIGTAKRPDSALAELTQQCIGGDERACMHLGNALRDEASWTLVPVDGPLIRSWVSAASQNVSDGRLDRARTMATLISSKEPAAADVLLASIAIDEGRFDDARRSVADLAARGPAFAVEAAVLKTMTDTLVAGKPAVREVFATWGRHGRPDLRRSRILGFQGVWDLLSSDKCSAKTRERQSIDRFLATAGMDARVEVPREVVALAMSVPTEATFEDRLLALWVLGAETLPDDLAEQARTRGAFIARSLEGAAPGNAAVALAIIGWQRPPRGRLTEQELAILEAAAASPLDAKRVEIRERVVRAQARMPEHPKKGSLLPLLSVLDVYSPYSLHLRAEESSRAVTDAERRRLARILVAYGRKFTQGPWLLDQGLGALLLRSAGNLANEPALVDEANAIRERMRPQFFINEVGLWPSSRFQDEWDAAASITELKFFADLATAAGVDAGQ